MYQIYKGKSLVPIIIFSALGLLGNIHSYEIFFNVNLTFGGVFAVLAVMLLGRVGVIAAFAASLYTFFIWGHPYAVIIFTCEGLFLSVYGRRWNNFVKADFIYWVFVGIPFMFIFYYFAMGLNLYMVELIVMRQSVNAVLAAFAASVLYDIGSFIVPSAKNGEPKFSYRHIVFQTVLSIIIVPMVILLAINVNSGMKYTSEGLQRELNNATQAVSTVIDDFLRENVKVINLAEQIVRDRDVSPDGHDFMESSLIKLIQKNEYMTSISITDETLQEVGYVHLSNNKDNVKPQSLGFIEFADPDWREKDPYFSGVFTGISGGNRQAAMYIVKKLKAYSSKEPIYVIGALNFDTFEDKIRQMTKGSDVKITLVDRNRKIMMSTDNELISGKMMPDRMSLGSNSAVSEVVDLWAPDENNYISEMARWKKSLFTRTVYFTDNAGYSMIIDMPLGRYVDFMNSSGVRSLSVIFIIIILSVCFGCIISNFLTKEMRNISAVAIDLPQRVSGGEKVEWDETILFEGAEIKKSFKIMSEELSKKFRELQTQKEEIETLLSNIPMCILLKDTDNNIIKANNKAAEIFGLKAEELTGKHLGLFLPDVGYFYEVDQEVIEKKEPMINVLTKYNPVNGREFLARTNRVPIFNEAGDVESILVIVNDITDEVKASEEKERMLGAMNKQARMAELGAMLSIIIHQWKQPLNIISLASQTVRDDIQDDSWDKETVSNDLDTILQNTEFLSQTISDFTGFFNKSKNTSLFNVNSVVSEVQHLIDKQFIKNGIIVNIDNTDAFEIKSLKNEFKQVCLNLFNNASDAIVSNNDEERTIKVRYRVDGDEGQIIFSDTGGGISSQLLPHKIFDAYVTTKGENGSGIGLYICKNIIEDNMGGHISASNDEQGAVFIITLPLSRFS
ncbi:ATP-binding protein [Deferribacteres bacterium DY0037]